MSVHFKSDILAKHRELADAIKNNLQMTDNIITEKEVHSSYNSNLPEGITPETVKTLSKYNNNFTRSAHIAVGEMAADFFQKHTDVHHVDAKLGYFADGDSLNFSVDRERQYPNPQAGDGEPTKITKHLVMDCGEEIRGQSVKSIKRAISEEFKLLS